MRKYRSFILLLAVLLVFVGVYVGLKHLPEETEEEVTYVAYVLDVTEISYKKQEGEMKFVEQDGSWIYPADEKVALDQSKVTSLVDNLSEVKAERILENPDALADYGLEEPAYTLTLKDGNGSETILSIGNATGDSYYAKKEGSDTVYTISSTFVESMEFDISALQAEEETEETKESENETTTETTVEE